MAKLYNLARMTSATTGTGTLTLGAAVSGYLTFALAGVQNGDLVFYGIKDGSNSEVGWGTYSSTGPTITRSVLKSTNSNTAISCSGSEEVYITALASDGGDLLPGFDHPMRGFDLPLNLQLNASVASNVLTVAVKGNNGADPSNSNPVLIPFRDPTVANGDPVWRAITGALSINTVAAGASLGAGTNAPFRLWVVAFDNAGTVVLGLWQSVTGGATPTAIAPLNEANVASSTAMSSTSNAAATFYTQSAVTSKAFRILGYMDFAGQATPGSYTAAPVTIQLFGPGIKKPGDVLQTVIATTTATDSLTSTTYTATANHRVTITPTAAPNLVLANLFATLNSSGNQAVIARWARGTTSNTNLFGSETVSSPPTTGGADGAGICCGLDAPGTTSATTYTVNIRATSSTASFAAFTDLMQASEVMV